MDVCKAYDSLDRGSYMEILWGYGMGQRMARLIVHHWDNLMFAPKVKRLLGTLFCMVRGVTQGYPASPMILNIVVDAVVRSKLKVVCIPQEARHGMGWSAGEHNLIFYADGRRIGGRNHIWVQGDLTVSVAIFQHMGLETNLEKTKALVCTPGYIWGKCSEADYKRRSTGEGATFRERNRVRVICTVFMVKVATLSMKVHVLRQHDRSLPQTREV